MERLLTVLRKLNNAYVVTSLVIIIGLIGTYRSCTVKKDGVYTIAKVYNLKKARGGIRYDFEYKFENKIYRSYATSPTMTLSDEGSHFFIQVLENDPSRCFMTKVPVPSYIEEAPYDGWKELPVPHD